jgi:hypothetical protein
MRVIIFCLILVSTLCVYNATIGKRLAVASAAAYATDA